MEIANDVIVFDLDGTLLDGDSTGVWIRRGLLKFPLRSFIAMLTLPITLPMLAFIKTRHRAAGFLIWLASKGMSEGDLKASFKSFAEKIGTDGFVLNWRQAGLDLVRQYQESGDEVVIVTAAPEWLASSLFETLDLEVAVIGSTLKPRRGGWTGDEPCSHEAKCSRLKERGYGEHWAAAYTDSPDDIPLLMRAKRPYVVNCHRKAKAKKFSKFVPNYEILWW